VGSVAARVQTGQTAVYAVGIVAGVLMLLGFVILWTP
jgi:hypothetical protein